jgi:beta-galactosidase
MKTLMVVIVLLSGCASFCSGAVGDLTSGQSMTTRISFDDGWLFARFGQQPDGSVIKEPQGVEKGKFNDAAWQSLNLPHDWGIEGPFRKDLPSSTGKLPWAGIGWYRKHFSVPSQDSGRRFFVDFDGAMSHTKVWLNGIYLGEWPYGYASFRFEMTQHLKLGGDNVLAVRLDNPPNSSRWYPGGGIYRNVWLVESDEVHVANCGIFITSPKVAPDGATLHISAEIENQSPSPAIVDVGVEILRPGDRAVAGSSQSIDVQIPAGQIAKCGMEISISSPLLWGPETPFLYGARTIVRKNGVIIDQTETAFGIRTAEFSPDSGFVLNGGRVYIKGVCNHHDLGLTGTAVNTSALERQIRLLKEMGCNAIRTSHNPPSPELLELCDRMGMLVLDEAFDCWEKGKTPNDYSTLFTDWHAKDIRAFVRRDRNHPSVIAWSAGNEVAEQQGGELFQKLRAIFLEEDATRPVTAACDQPDAGFNGFQKFVDVFGYNYKPRLYTKFHEANLRTPLFGSETASCISTNGEYLFPVSDDQLKGYAGGQVSSYDLYAPPWATTPDVEFEGQDRNPFVAGEFVWTGFDYLGEPTPYSDDTSGSRSAYFGILDLCGFKKDRFFLYQSRWRPDLPSVHILPHWNWPDRIGEVTPVHVYTSGDEAELFLNGKSLGKKSKQPYQYRLRWDDVRYAPGELKVVAYKSGKEWASSFVKTAGVPARVELISDRVTIASDGQTLAYVTVRVVDAQGELVPTARPAVRFSLVGPGTIAAAGNGDPTELTTFRSDNTKCFHGQCLLIVQSVKGKSGEIKVTADVDGLVSAILVVTAL